MPYSTQRPAQHGIAADRFAREIGGILKVSPSALAAAECQPVGRTPTSTLSVNLFCLIAPNGCASIMQRADADQKTVCYNT
jgi:hypothetical protein